MLFFHSLASIGLCLAVANAASIRGWPIPDDYNSTALETRQEKDAWTLIFYNADCDTVRSSGSGSYFINVAQAATTVECSTFPPTNDVGSDFSVWQCVSLVKGGDYNIVLFTEGDNCPYTQNNPVQYDCATVGTGSTPFWSRNQYDFKSWLVTDRLGGQCNCCAPPS